MNKLILKSCIECVLNIDQFSNGVQNGTVRYFEQIEKSMKIMSNNLCELQTTCVNYKQPVWITNSNDINLLFVNEWQHKQ